MYVYVYSLKIAVVWTPPILYLLPYSETTIVPSDSKPLSRVTSTLTFMTIMSH